MMRMIYGQWKIGLSDFWDTYIYVETEIEMFFVNNLFLLKFLVNERNYVINYVVMFLYVKFYVAFQVSSDVGGAQSTSGT